MTNDKRPTIDTRPPDTSLTAVIGRWSLVVIVGLWTLALYSHILRLPFFRDDMVMLLWLRDMAWSRLWTDATGFPYYRPLSFATLKLSELFFGYSQPYFLHIVNLFFHAANSIMLALLTRLVFNARGRTLAALSAGLLYAAYPFTFEIMPTTGPIFQLQAAFFALAAALAYARWRNTEYVIRNTQCATRSAYSVLRKHLWLILSLLMALLGSFTCEYSVIIPPMIIVTEIMLWWQSKKQDINHPVTLSPCHPVTPSPPLPLSPSPRLLVPLSYFAFTALYLAIWLGVPKTRSTLPWLWLHDLGYKTLYYAQGLTYPLQPLALPLARGLNLKPLTEGAALSGEWAWPAVLLLAILALAGLLTVFARNKRLDLFAFGLFWWGIALAPMWPTLNWDYTWNGPRLHYIPALGAALMWGSIVGFLATENTERVKNSVSAIKLFLGLSVLFVALAPSVLFLRAQAEAVITGGQIVDDVVRTVTALPPDESVLIVNFPSWISPARQTYAIGAEGITFLPGYSSLADLVEINTRQRRNVKSVTFTNVWKDWDLNQRFYTPPLTWEELLPNLRTTSRVFQVQYTPEGTRLAEAGNIQAAPPAAPDMAVFDERVSLAQVSNFRQADQLVITLEWIARASVEANWTVFLHIYDNSGTLVAQGDGDPLLGLYPLWAWQPGELVRDIRYANLAKLPPGRYRVGVGLYDRDTGARVTAIKNQRFANDTVPLFEFENILDTDKH